MISIVLSFMGCNSQLCAFFQILSLLIIQILFLVYIILVKAFEEKENNFIEIFAELIFGLLLII